MKKWMFLLALATNVAAIDHGIFRARDLQFANATAGPVAKCTNVTRRANARCVVPRRAVRAKKIGEGSNGTSPLTFEYDHDGVWKKGKTPATLTVTDGEGRNDTCTFQVKVVDRTPPFFDPTCPTSPIVKNTLKNKCFASVDYTAPVGKDNCNGTKTKQIAGKASGGRYKPGNHTVTFRATDAAGLKVNCSFTVTVIHNQDPIITCANTSLVLNATGNATADNCTATMIDVTDGIVEAEDTCGVQNLTQNIGVGEKLKPGSYSIFITAIDKEGNSANETCSFNVTNATCS